MNKLSSFSLTLGAALLLGLSLSARAQNGATEEQHGQPKAAEAYVPGLGDFMAAYVQPHHIKLWVAVSKGNWTLAAYEAHELKETFDDVIANQGNWHKVPVGSMVTNLIFPPLMDVQQAIKTHNKAGFKKAYGQLTAACLSCHQGTQHDFVVIQVPKGSSFIADQHF